jgi:phosphoglycerate dehydrogenase-like enzyme
LLKEAEVLYTWDIGFELSEAPGLRWVQLFSAGADHLLGKPIMDSDIPITSSSGIHAIPLAEYAFASMLMFARKFHQMGRFQSEHHWPKRRWRILKGGELWGATLGIVGYGSIGQRIGQLARCFGMRVLALKRSPHLPPQGKYLLDGVGDLGLAIPERIFAPQDARLMLARCDFVVVVVPSIPETHGLIGQEELRAMPSHSYLLDISRGRVVDEDALLRALTEGWIAGAGRDVFSQEPLPQDSPFWDLPNFILTPHIGGNSVRYDDRVVDVFCQNLNRYLEKEPLLNLVDKKRGY